MKKISTPYLAALALGTMLTAGTIAQTTVETTTNSAGTITEFIPDTIIIRSETTPQPIDQQPTDG